MVSSKHVSLSLSLSLIYLIQTRRVGDVSVCVSKICRNSFEREREENFTLLLLDIARVERMFLEKEMLAFRDQHQYHQTRARARAFPLWLPLEICYWVFRPAGGGGTSRWMYGSDR